MGGATKISNAFSKDVFSNINNICVVINGVEYSSIAKSYATNQTYVYVDDKRLEKLSIYDKTSQKIFYQILKECAFINAITSVCIDDQIVFDLSFQEYQRLLMKILDRNDLSEDQRYIAYWISPIHVIKKSEVEYLYRYQTSVVLNGVEVYSWYDGGDKDAYPFPSIDYMPNYILVDYDESQKVDSIPSSEVIHKQAGNPHDLFYSFNCFPKKYLDRIILRRRYMDSSNFENDYLGEFTGQYNCWTLDLSNPNSKVLEFMKVLGVIKPL
jgi:hypothetical protein